MVAVYADNRELDSRYGQQSLASYHREGVWHDQISQRPELNLLGEDRPMPISLILRYAGLAVRHAIVEQQEDGQWLATIRDFPGVWACEESAVEALDVLKEVVFEWALLKLEDSDRDLPTLGDIDLNVA